MIDRQERVPLCRNHGESSWRPIKARVTPGRPTRFSVIHVLDPLFSHWLFAATPVVGRFTPQQEQGDQAILMRIFVVRDDSLRAVNLRAHAHLFPDADYVWHSLIDVEGEDFDAYTRELGLFLRGYLEGWIPDRVITLVEWPHIPQVDSCLPHDWCSARRRSPAHGPPGGRSGEHVRPNRVSKSLHASDPLPEQTRRAHEPITQYRQASIP
ncbi:hypothetical protein ACFVUW_19140 [Streptomyces xiamenensis]|uniref:hypothetical protein n=1 Tax=Streptomyces xiamenensis TaxID=408015 RepID=UPI0036E35938